MIPCQEATGKCCFIMWPGSVQECRRRQLPADAGGIWRAAVSAAPRSTMIPLQPSDPGKLGKAHVFLSSDASSFITGIELFCDGGMAQTG